jgi:acyl-CoA reductase-like NAD-dependent aldehyde dehydrogenase
MPPRPILICGEWRTTARTRPVTNPYDNAVVGEVCQAGPADIEDALAGAHAAFKESRKLSSAQRTDGLSAVARGVKDRKEDLAAMITRETGKPITFARAEVDRTEFTFRTAAEEAGRIYGEMLPLDMNAASAGRFALVRRFPIGPVAAITPFNFPLNLVAHKLAPAFATGNPVVLKPSSNAPATALMLAEIIIESGLPGSMLSVIPCAGDESIQLITDERVALITFTGSPAIGWGLKSRAGRKRVTLELGGNAGVIIDLGCDLPFAAGKVVAGGFANAGQSCISVQRVYLHREHADEFLGMLMAQVKGLVVGDPWNERTVVGPMITRQAAEQAESWIGEAVSDGATVLTGGTRSGAVLEPTVLTHVTRDMKVCCQEVFAPVITVETFDVFDDALARVNDSAYGLQAGVFTPDLRHMFRAYEELEVGGVIVNDVPTYRMDHMPYGGVKGSGFGREGVRYAMEEMTERKLLAVNPR